MKNVTIRSSGGEFYMLAAMDAMLLAFPLYTVARIGAMNPREIAVIAVLCAGYYWIIGCYSAFLFMGSIHLNSSRLTLRVPQTVSFFRLKVQRLRIPVCDIAQVCIGDEETIRTRIPDYRYSRKINDFFKTYRPWSYYYTRSAAPKEAMAVVTNAGEMVIVGITTYSQTKIKRLLGPWIQIAQEKV